MKVEPRSLVTSTSLQTPIWYFSRSPARGRGSPGSGRLRSSKGMLLIGITSVCSFGLDERRHFRGRGLALQLPHGLPDQEAQRACSSVSPRSMR